MPAADDFPAAPFTGEVYPLELLLCQDCGLVYLGPDPAELNEPRAVEPQALTDQAIDALARVRARGIITPSVTVREFHSPHGNGWSPHLQDTTILTSGQADIVIDSIGIMHDGDQRAAFAQRIDALAENGTFLLHVHPVSTIITHHQWAFIRHGHYAYYSLTALQRILADFGLTIATVDWFELYGGTIMLTASRDAHPDDTVRAALAAEADLQITSPASYAELQHRCHSDISTLAQRLTSQPGPRYAYAAASRAVALMANAGLTTAELTAVADASPGKQGRFMPGTNIPIISPEELCDADPQTVWVTIPDLMNEVASRYPQLAAHLLSEL